MAVVMDLGDHRFEYPLDSKKRRKPRLPSSSVALLFLYGFSRNQHPRVWYDQIPLEVAGSARACCSFQPTLKGSCRHGYVGKTGAKDTSVLAGRIRVGAKLLAVPIRYSAKPSRQPQAITRRPQYGWRW